MKIATLEDTMAHSLRKVCFYRCSKSKYHQRLVHTRNRARLRGGYYDISNKQYKLIVDTWDICDYKSVTYPWEVGKPPATRWAREITPEWYNEGRRK